MSTPKPDHSNESIVNITEEYTFEIGPVESVPPKDPAVVHNEPLQPFQWGDDDGS